ncbi:hypothetical protein H634G_06863 [Metarhizium anisopliae BRIP 53293]|uniref:Uncharacterized protein n=1 Tax=Metarhizium anisopliae BRIP 53293 TaxID=1291518 RepID=A0A0D9NVI9_METAN|nr:hypothetical protein H634G_06863 [Metarhizium anisopliae BRIP 53293]KJK88241.1 hypothetical protein H633G_07896 [Metarhizium anisopliae BRIP 53284]
MSSTLLAYGSDYGSDTRTQTPGLGGYNASMMMYNVPPHTAAQQAVYDTQQFTPRQHAAMQMMPSDVASSYFVSDTSGGAATSLQASGQGSSTSYQHQNTGIGYPSSMSELQQSGGANAGMSASRDADDAIALKWSSYQRQLGTVFRDVSDGQLERASSTLLELSKWLLPQVPQLGLHQDDPSLHEERLKLWNDFNHGWLSLAYQQKQLMTSGQQISNSQRLMTKDQIEGLGDELVRLCDGLERHGLVDYQYGVWEEQIEEALEACLDLFPK